MVRWAATIILTLLLTGCAPVGEPPPPAPGPAGTAWPELAECLTEWGQLVDEVGNDATAPKDSLVALVSAACAVSVSESKPAIEERDADQCFRDARRDYREQMGYTRPWSRNLTTDQAYATILCGPRLDPPGADNPPEAAKEDSR